MPETKEKVKNVAFRATEEMHKQIRIICAQEGVHMQEFLTNIVEKELKERGMTEGDK